MVQRVIELNHEFIACQDLNRCEYLKMLNFIQVCIGVIISGL